MKLRNLSLLLAISCMTHLQAQKVEQNPFFTEYKTTYKTPPFDQIKMEHYESAFLKGIKQQNVQIQAIVANKNVPTFENTIVALDNSGEILRRVGGVFFNLTEAETNSELTALSVKIAPTLSEHNDNIYLSKNLFSRIKSVYAQKSKLKLTTEQEHLLDLYYKRFIRSGANLNAEKQARLREINKELSTLEIDFSNHVLNETNAYQLVISDKKDLSGLPEWFIESAAEDAKAQGKEGKWIFTLRNASRLPFLQYADNRELRKQVYNAYINRATKEGKNDNRAIVAKVITLRLEKSKLLGYDTFASFTLDENMAKTPTKVMDFLDKLWGYSIANAKKEAAELQTIMDKDNKGQKLAGWDWWYYAEKLRQEKYNLNEEVLKPYFKIENVRDGAFAVAHKLYGITLTELTNVPVYHQDVKAFEVKDKDGSHLGIFYVDYFPRAGKRSGAWMNNYKEQIGKNRPVICNVASFTKPSGNTPSLLTIDEVETLFHEFGHALHGLLTKCNYAGVSGTSVARDFVELPSQVMEHWATEPEVLKMYAKNYKTGEVIPDSLIQKIKDQAHFNQGFMTTELLASAILDMNLHMLKDAKGLDIIDFEKKAMDKIGLIPEIAPRYRCTYFNHIVGGYAAGYYSYLWANVLDADAFEAFKEKGIFDQETATSFRKNVLEKGGSDDPMTLYKKFRGAEPKLEPMLKNRGLQ